MRLRSDHASDDAVHLYHEKVRVQSAEVESYFCSMSLRYLATASRIRYDRDGIFSFAMRSSILSRIKIGRVAVMLAILLDLLPSIKEAFWELGSI